jgi:membrane-associated phospholipid phosphatase
MKHDISHTGFLLFIMLSCIAAGVDAQAAGSIETTGDVFAVALPAAAAGLIMTFGDDSGALELGKSLSLALGVTYGLKFSIDEERPNGNNQSFPSAHTSLSFSSAEFIRKRYGWYYGLPAYVAASFVAYSRVASKQHYTHDVIAGAAIGIGGSYLFTHHFKGWRIQPDIAHESYGIRLCRIW